MMSGGSNRGHRAGKKPNLFGDDNTSPAIGDGQLRLDEEEISITLRRAWDRALRMLSQRVNKPTFETHLRGLRPLSLSEEQDERGQMIWHVTLGAPSSFVREWVEKRHALVITQTLEEIFDVAVLLRFALSPKENNGTLAGSPSRPANSPLGARQAIGTGQNALLSLDLDTEGLNPASSPESPVQGNVTVSQPRSEATASERPERPTSKPLPVAPPPPSPAYQPTSTPAAKPTGASTVREFSREPGTGYTHSTSTASARSASADAPDINPRYTFDRFVVGPTNRLAHGGALAVAEAPGERFNPLFLYGSPGLGKTHLMHAIANNFVQARGEQSARRVAYMSGETFTTQFVTSLRQKKAEEFRRKWRNVDLWLVDDIQFIAGKEHTKEEFFHTFNALYQAGKQIVICSDRSPRELRAMDERLRSRFECGLVADIVPPDLETRLAILQKKAENESTRVPDDVLLYMARLVQSNIRTLEGALVKLIAYASLVNSPVTTQMAAGILERYFIAAGAGELPTGFSGDSPLSSGQTRGKEVFVASAAPAVETILTSSPQPPTERPVSAAVSTSNLTADMVQRAVAARFGLTQDELTGKRRDRDAVNARQVAMLLLRELTELSLPGIGQLFGGRDHTTVIHACDRVKAQIPFDPDLRSLVEELMTQMRVSQSGPNAPQWTTDQLGL